MNKKGQITIFVIIGILLVVSIILFIIFYNKIIPEPPKTTTEDPEEYMENCINTPVEESIEKIYKYSGYTSPRKLSINFTYPLDYYKQGTFRDISLLCYSPKDYTPCIMIEPNLIRHLEKEIYEYIENDVKRCYKEYEKELKSKQYDTDFSKSSEVNFSVELMEGKVKIPFEGKIYFNKNEVSKKSDRKVFVYNSKVYDIFILAQEILRQEAKYYNSDYGEIMMMNNWAKITKYQTGDDFKIYTIKDTNTEKETKFAIKNAVLGTPL